jgi:hypothetical protein
MIPLVVFIVLLLTFGAGVWVGRASKRTEPPEAAP